MPQYVQNTHHIYIIYIHTHIIHNVTMYIYIFKLYYNDTCLSFIYSRQPCNKLSLFNPNALGKTHSPASRPSILPLPVKYSLLIKP